MSKVTRPDLTFSPATKYALGFQIVDDLELKEEERKNMCVPGVGVYIGKE